MIHKFCFCLLLVMFLLACATPQKYDAKLNSLIGKNESVLAQEFGSPSSQKIINSTTKVLTYTKLENMYVPSEFYEYNMQPFVGADDVYYPFSQMYIYNPMQDYLGVEVTRICKTSFLIEHNIIESWKWEGNNCVAGM